MRRHGPFRAFHLGGALTIFLGMLVLVPGSVARATTPDRPLITSPAAIFDGADAIAIGQAPSSCTGGLVGLWHGNGNARDSACGHDGVLVGPVAFLPGIRGQAFAFSGAHATVRVARVPQLVLRRAVSIDFWVKPAVSNTVSACCQGLVTTDFYGVEISAGRTTRVGINFFISTDNGATFQHTSDLAGGGYTVFPGRWEHVTGIYDGRRLRLFLNGLLVSTTPHTGLLSSMLPTSFLGIGSEDGRTYNQSLVGARYFHGLIEDVRIFNRAIR